VQKLLLSTFLLITKTTSSITHLLLHSTFRCIFTQNTNLFQTPPFFSFTSFYSNYPMIFRMRRNHEWKVKYMPHSFPYRKLVLLIAKIMDPSPLYFGMIFPPSQPWLSEKGQLYEWYGWALRARRVIKCIFSYMHVMPEQLKLMTDWRLDKQLINEFLFSNRTTFGFTKIHT